jgi:hypothetical protein
MAISTPSFMSSESAMNRKPSAVIASLWRAIGVVVVCLLPVQADAAWSSPIVHAAYGFASNTGGTTGSSWDTTGADIIFVEISWYSSGGVTAALSDSKSNTWTVVNTRTSADSNSNRLYYCASPCSVGSGHTFTVTDGIGGLGVLYPSLAILAMSGSNASQSPTETGATGSSALSTGSFTPGDADSLIVTSVGTGGTSHSVGGGFTAQSVDNVGGVSLGSGIAYLVQSGGPSAVNPAWSWTGGGTGATTIAAFQIASGGTGGSIRCTLTLLGVGAC